MPEERINEVIETLRNLGPRAVNYLVEDSLENYRIGSSCTGYSFRLSSLGYRGTWLSTIEDIDLIVDGKAVPKNQILFCANGKRFMVHQLKEMSAEFLYPLGDTRILVHQIGGLPAGTHSVELTLWKHADYGHTPGEPLSARKDSMQYTLNA